MMEGAVRMMGAVIVKICTLLNFKLYRKTNRSAGFSMEQGLERHL